jgi:hypothetical protein
LVIRINKGKKRKPSKNPSYKGGMTIYDTSNSVYKGDRFYIKYPVIDKIALLGNAHFTTNEDKEDFKQFIYSIGKATEDGEVVDYPLEWHKYNNPNDYARSRYRHHFKIKGPNGEELAMFSFQPFNEEYRFLKLEFNPAKIGIEGVEYIKRWYDDTILHSSFSDIINYKKCISKLDIAIDIIGVDIADLILNYNSKEVSQRYHSAGGLLESYYPHCDKPPSDIIVYDRNALEEDDEEEESFPETYSSQRPRRKKSITRVEKTIETERPLTELYKLKPHFKDLKVHLAWKASDKSQFPEAGHNWILFLDSVRWRGFENALELVPQSLQKDYKRLFEENVENIFEVYTHSDSWREIWTESIKRSGLL